VQEMSWCRRSDRGQPLRPPTPALNRSKIPRAGFSVVGEASPAPARQLGLVVPHITHRHTRTTAASIMLGSMVWSKKRGA